MVEWKVGDAYSTSYNIRAISIIAEYFIKFMQSLLIALNIYWQVNVNLNVLQLALRRPNYLFRSIYFTFEYIYDLFCIFLYYFIIILLFILYFFNIVMGSKVIGLIGTLSCELAMGSWIRSTDCEWSTIEACCWILFLDWKDSRIDGFFSLINDLKWFEMRSWKKWYWSFH